MRHRSDTTKAAIVKGLRNCGYRVEIIERPVDLMVMVGKNYWRLLEVKSPRNKKGEPAHDPRQTSQDRFLEETHTPRVTSVEQALKALLA